MSVIINPGSGGGGGGGGLVVGGTTITGGAAGNILIDNGGILQEQSGRIPLAGGNLNFYVATTGSDSNPGTIGSPFATLDHALLVAAGFDYQLLWSPQINIEDGTYVEAGEIFLPALVGIDANNGAIVGNHATPANVVFTFAVAGTGAFSAFNPGSNWFFDGITVDTSFAAFTSGNLGFILFAGSSLIVSDTAGGGSEVFVFSCFGFGTITCVSSTITLTAAQLNQFTNLDTFCAVQVSNTTINTPVALTLIGSWLINQRYSNTDIRANTYNNFAGISGPSLVQVTDSSTRTDNGLISDLPGTYTFASDQTCSISANAPGVASQFVEVGSGLPTTGGISAAGYSVTKNSTAAAGAGNRIVFNDAGVLFVVGSGAPYKVSAPSAAATVTSSIGLRSNILNPAGTLATLTVNLPTVMMDGEITRISTSQLISAITFATTDSSAIVGAPSTLLAGSAVQFLFDASVGAHGTWYIN